MDLLVAIVSYKTILSVPRKGLTTSWLSSLKPGTVWDETFPGFLLPRPLTPLLSFLWAGARVPVRFDTSGLLKLPPSPAPLVMIGPGTGVAPFRALMEERIRAGADGAFDLICSLYVCSMSLTLTDWWERCREFAILWLPIRQGRFLLPRVLGGPRQGRQAHAFCCAES